MRVLLVEDDIDLAQGLIKALGYENIIVDHVTSGKDAILVTKTKDHGCEMVILDLGLPDIDGFEVLKQIRLISKKLPVLILTARVGVDNKVNGLNSGADDYLTKPFEMEELMARLRVIGRHLGTIDSNKFEVSGVTIDTESHKVYFDQSNIELPRKEYMVLKALMENAGRILSREQIESKLYAWGEEVSSNAVEVHVHHIRKKLPQGFIKNVRGVGYIVDK